MPVADGGAGGAGPKNNGGTKPPKGGHKPPKNGNHGGGKSDGASNPGNGGSGDLSGVLNPPFDPRMRKVGSPLNLSHEMKRGWAITEDGTKRVNFLFNPSSITVSNAVDPMAQRQDTVPEAVNDAGGVQVFADNPISQGAVGLDLLYDRTYEMFSGSKVKNQTIKNNDVDMAEAYGVYADVAAWWTLVGMYEQMPKGWHDSIPVSPMMQIPMYLFIGPYLLYYGFIDNLGVTYSHWSQRMIPQRCKVSVSFSMLPKPGGSKEVSEILGDLGTFFGGDTWSWDLQGSEVTGSEAVVPVGPGVL